MVNKDFVGVDISKESLDVALLTSEGEMVEMNCLNERLAIRQVLESLLTEYGLDHSTLLICAEHTGHFGNKLIEECVKGGFRLWMESPYNILHSQGLIRGKNDKVDAIRIMEYAKRFSDRARTYCCSDISIEVLQRLSVERDLLVKDISKYQGQLKQEESFFDSSYFKGKVKRVEKLISHSRKILAEIEAEIDALIADSDQIRNNMDKMLSIDGVGRQTALATIIATGNFTKFQNARQFVCHAGCAPFRYESGTSVTSRNRISHRANKNLKRIFHMAAVSTLRTNGELRQYYDRKVDEGKNKMSVINAIRAKLIGRIFAVVKENRKYEKNYTPNLV
jgi:transposase